MAVFHRMKRYWIPTPVKATRESTKLVDCPNLLDNVWRLAYICSHVWMSKYRLFAYTKEEMEDIENHCLLNTYTTFLTMVRTGSYSREHSMYLNMRSAAWSAVGRYMHSKRTQKSKLAAETISLGHVDVENCGEGWLSTIASERIPKMLTDYEIKRLTAERVKKKKALSGVKIVNEKLSIAARERMAKKAEENAYWEYLEECAEFGIDAVDRDSFGS